jgi:hypothetical protein
VQGAQVGARERSGGFGGSEENEIHVTVGGAAWGRGWPRQCGDGAWESGG